LASDAFVALGEGGLSVIGFKYSDRWLSFRGTPASANEHRGIEQIEFLGVVTYTTPRGGIATRAMALHKTRLIKVASDTVIDVYNAVSGS